jgi:tetratricopeptide (TPR) repeat protein/4-amino-4-deoxy-L-arabinose transferase-like glycosyltransferase
VSDNPANQPAPAGPAEMKTDFSLPVPGPATRPTLVEILLLLGILLLAAVLRVYRLDAKSLWLDEIFFANAAQQGGLLGPYGALAGTHAPLYLLLVRLASLAGEAEWALRLPAAIASTLGVAALWALGRRMLGPVVGLLAALFLALSAMHIEFAQEVHAYALLATLSTLLLWSLLRAAQSEAGVAAVRPGRPVGRIVATWAPFVLLAVLAIYTHSYALVAVGLSALIFPLLLAFWRSAQPSPQPASPAASSRRALLHLFVALAVVAVAALPLLAGQQAAPGETGQGAAALRLAAERGATLGSLWLAFVTYRPNWLMDPLFFTAVTGWWLIGLAWLLWRRRPLGLALALWLALPVPLIAWIASAAGFSLTPRRLIFLLPVFQLLVAVGVVTAARLAALFVQGVMPDRRRLGGATYGLLLALSVLAFAKGSADPAAFIYRKPKQDWRTLAAILDSQPGQRDQIVLTSGANGPLQWYLKAPAAVVDTDLAGALEGLCQGRDALYVAEATTRRPLGQQDTDYLAANFIRVPLADLNLWYRNCQPGAWYGAGAEALFPLALHPDLSFPATRAAQEEYAALAAVSAGLEQPDPAAPLADESAPAAQPTATPAPTPEPIDAEALLASLLEADAETAAGQTRLGVQALHAQQKEASPAGSQDDAYAYFQRAVEMDPAAALAYALWADGLGSTGQITQALQVLDQGLAALPGDPALESARARWQAAPAADAAASAQEEDAAYRAALAAGRIATRDRRWEDVIATAQQAIAMAPARYEAHLLLGDAYRGLGELAQALQAYQRATDRAPQQSILQGRQAEMLARLGRFDEAAAAGLNALAMDPALWENWYALGRVYMAAALAGLETETGPSAQETGAAARWAEALLLRAQELAPSENTSPARALDELRAALPSAAPAPDTGPDYAGMTMQERSEARVQADRDLQFGQPAEALAVYQQLVAVDAQDRASRMGVANALAALGRADEALAALAAIGAEWPDFPFAAIRRGALLEEQGDQAGALAAYREAVAVAPDNADTHFTLAFALRRAGQSAEAINAFEAGLAIDPSRDSARQALEALQAEQ